MKVKEIDPIDGSRGKTDKSLEDERFKTDKVIDEKRAKVEKASDEKTRLNRIEADSKLEKVRANVDRGTTNNDPQNVDQDLINERVQSDKAQIIARIEEDRIRIKERFQKKLIAEASLVDERKDTDSNLLEEREHIDASHDQTKDALITRDQFLAVVSHDLKNPLSSISLGVSLMRISLSKEEKNQENLKFLEIIERNAAHMDRLISDLLDVERMSNNKLILNTKLINTKDLLQECRDLFAPISLKKSISILIDPKTTSVSVLLDHDRILQVLSNLIGNALKFSPDGSLITLSARALEKDIEISVSDNGPGIPETKKSKIFDRFSQLKTNDRRGLGLGLFISKWIVTAHHGQIHVTSKINQGSTFTFTLPMRKLSSEL